MSGIGAALLFTQDRRPELAVSVHRLFIQIERILRINGLSTITDDVVEAARSTLVIGAI